VRKRADELQERRSSLPAQLEAARADREDASTEAEARRALAAEAEAPLADAADHAHASREATRARDHARMAERRLEAARDHEQELAAEAERAGREQAVLTAQAREIAAALRERPGLTDHAGVEPGEDLGEVSRWATEARAALFVARGQLATQREQLIRQANELGAAVLGEPLAASSAAVVARRVESASG